MFPLFVKVKLLPVKHWLAGSMKFAIINGPSLMVTVAESIQLLSSVTYTVYIPGAKLVAVAVF